MAQRKRPTAFDVSFPDEAPLTTTSLRGEDGQRGNSNSSASDLRRPTPKRKVREHGAEATRYSNAKRSRTGIAKRKVVREDTPELHYSPQPEDMRETKNTIISGEDADDADDDGVPVRMLSDFSIFDHNYQLYSLHDENLLKYDLHAAGCVASVYLNEEDEGQEDDVTDSIQRLRTTTILRYSLDYEIADDPLYIQTEHAWYQLQSPSEVYRTYYQSFYRPHRIAQIVISAARDNRRITWDEVLASASVDKDPLLGTRIRQGDFEASVPLISVVLAELRDGQALRNVPALQDLLSENASSAWQSLPRSSQHPIYLSKYRPKKTLGYRSKNLDLAVLRPENQNPTHVTPLIDQLARGWFIEKLHVVGARLPDERRSSEAKRARLWMLERLGEYIERQSKKRVRKSKNPPPLDCYPREHRIVGEYWSSVILDDVKYSVDDVILTPRGTYDERKERVVVMPDDLTAVPYGASIGDFFWFGRIIYIDQRRKKVHCQWFDHASRSILEEIADPRELFLWRSCGEIDVDEMYGKVTVHYKRHCSKPYNARLDNRADPSVFYCNYLCDEPTASFTTIEDDMLTTSQTFTPPDNCPSCLFASQQDNDAMVKFIRNGVTFRGSCYHENDYVLYRNRHKDGPAKIGQLLSFAKARGRESDYDAAAVRLLGRIADIHHLCPDGVLKDERHLFMTSEKTRIPIVDVISPCFIVSKESLGEQKNVDEWLALSPTHFFVSYAFPTATPSRWTERRRLGCNDVLVCGNCFAEDTAHGELWQDFVRVHKRRPLRAFDPFSGVGAFSLGMEDSGCIKTTGAVEISPSAAHTLRMYAPEVTVYNQCSNVVLQYAIKTFQGHAPERPREIGPAAELLPDPPKPGDVDIVVAGFPCQPHSRLNMFQRANDRKSNLILNILSWVDFLRPKYCVLENVRGFLSFNLRAYQVDEHRVVGGIEMGGLKFLIRALLAMRYQVRFGLLQAGHYGTPQSRVRFFLIAALDTHHLPLLPQPTHDFPLEDALRLRFSNGAQAQPIQAGMGTAPHTFVSVDDAIGDLPRFHWKDPSNTSSQHEHFADDNIPQLSCDPQKPYCGLPHSNINYHCNPWTIFQAKCRAEETTNLQQYTKVLPAATVRRVINIPLKPKADYRSLGLQLLEWQIANPSSAVARNGFPPGLYGRLDKDKWFNTTVTNVDPTAKQSWVLNPYCKRMVTVRELARSQGFPDSFIFHSHNEDVKTLHRQIGNAVPWPVASALGHELCKAILKRWHHDRQTADVIDVDS